MEDERARALVELAKELDPARVRMVNVGGGREAPYLEGYDVINAANRIFGFDGWSYRVDEVTTSTTSEGRILYRAKVTVEALGVSRTDVSLAIVELPREGANAGIDTPGAHEMAYKGAATDALKRALRSFGAQFGNDLYDKSPEARQQARGGGREQAERPAPERRADPAPKRAPGERTVGDFMAWANREHQLNTREVCDIVGVEKPAEIKDLAMATQAVLAVVANRAEATA